MKIILAFIGLIIVEKHQASHTIARQSSGTMHKNITRDARFSQHIECIVKGNTFLDFVWKWQEPKVNNPGYYFDTVLSQFHDLDDPDILVTSSQIISWKTNVPLIDRKTAAGVVYAEAEHGDGVFRCGETNISLQWIPGQASISPNETTFQHHQELKLECSSDDKGSPIGDVEWTTPDGLKNGSEIFILDSISLGDEGQYSCLYENKLGRGHPSPSVKVSVTTKCLPSVYLDSIIYEINSSFIYFHLEISNAYAAETLEILVCAAKDEGNPCTGNTTSIAQGHGIEEKIQLPKVSTGTYYNVTFFFRDDYRIVTRQMISFKGAVAPSSVPTLIQQNMVATVLAAIFGTLLLAVVVIFAVFVYWRYRHKGVPTTKENTMHYVNVGPQSDENYQRNTDGVENTGITGAYEDVTTQNVTTQDVTTRDTQSGNNSENTNYMQLDHNDIRQNRNRAPELTVYQSID